MPTSKAQQLIDDYAGNTWLIERHVEGLSHEESVLQPPFPANCLNWVLGHIISRRNSALQLLSAVPIWPEEVTNRYRSGSDPIKNAGEARELPALLQDLAQTQARIAQALEEAPPEKLNEVVETDRGTKPVWGHLAGLHWHETYPTGQLDILRAMALAQREWT